MARQSFPRDRFDELPTGSGRVGAHRAEHPRLRAGALLLWAGLATVVLVIAGIFGSLVLSGRIVLFPEAVATATPTPSTEPVLDTSYSVLILNATDEDGLATTMENELVVAGWSADLIEAGTAGSSGFEQTTIYYASAADEAAALGLADLIGGAEAVESTAYLQYYTGAQTDTKFLAVVIGLDRTAGATASAEPVG